MRFYWPGNFILSGRSDREIIETVEYYRSKGTPVELPSEENPITEQEKIIAIHFLPEVNFDVDLIEISPTEDVTFQVHPNAYLDLRNQAMSYESRLRGGLYQIHPRRDISRLSPIDNLPDPRIGCYFFFPKDVMEGLRKYNWERHAPEVVKGNLKREALSHPNLRLENTLGSAIKKLREEESSSN